MLTKTVSPKNVAAYFAAQPGKVRSILKQLRKAIRETVPEAEEVISYQMPALKYHGILVYYAAHKNHIGFYPKPSGIEQFREELSSFEISKGAIRFPMDKPLPIPLIRKIVIFRMRENLEREKQKTSKGEQ